MAKYVLKYNPPFEAIKWTGDNLDEVKAFCGDKCSYDEETKILLLKYGLYSCDIELPVGWYIVKEPFNKFNFSDPLSFENLYKEVTN